MTNADAEHVAARIDDLKAVSTGKPPSTGHSRKYDAALEKRNNDDPLVKLHQNDLNHAIGGMAAARDARDPKALEQSASQALASAKELDAARKGIESSGVFKAGNTFGKKAAIATGALATASIAAGATTGGIISWNNHIQGEQPKKT